jgi:geranylgeranyl reductase family protein
VKIDLIPEELRHCRWQIQPKELPSKRWDVVIVGAGPAGAAAAIRLAGRGHAVLLFEKYRFPREKICGDALLPDALQLLFALGLESDIGRYGARFSTMRAYSPGRIWFDVHGDYVTLPRAVVDTLIARHASNSGAIVCLGSVSEISTTSGGTQVKLDDRTTIAARYCMIATGSQVDLAQRAGLVADRGPTALAMRCYVRSDYRLEHAILSYDRMLKPGYAWIFPLGHGRYNVGCGMLLHGKSNAGPFLKKIFSRFMAEFPEARRLMASGEQLSHLTGAALRCGLDVHDAMANASTCAVGEVIGTTLPFTGEGIGTAMASSLAAADRIDRLLAGGKESLEMYQAEMRERFEPLFKGYRAAERWLAVSMINDLVAKRVRKSRFLQEACSGIILGTVRPSDVYSIKGILKSLVR